MAEELVKFGNYILLDRVAVGGMAEIWRAKTTGGEQGFERIVGLKCILSSYTQNEEFKSMFIEEARIASTLNHSNIVRITNFGSIDDKYYHEMEYVDGKSLRQIVKKARDLGIDVPIDCACFMIAEVCKGLNYAHMKHDSVTDQHLQIIHRDISPQNIMISYEGEVKIIDWGIAKAISNLDQTRAGVLKGKFGYMSPEQTAGIPLDLRSDIFSTAIVFYETLTGRRLFIAENEIATLKKIQECDITKPSQINGNIDADLERISMKGLERDREIRFQTCEEFYEAINSYMNQSFPSFSFAKLSKFVKEIFKNEIKEDKEKVKQYESSINSMSFNTKDEISGTEDKTRISSTKNQSSYNSFDRNSISQFTNANSFSSSNDEEKTTLAPKSASKKNIDSGSLNSAVDKTLHVSEGFRIREPKKRKSNFKPTYIVFILLFFIFIFYFYNNSKKTSKARSIIATQTEPNKIIVDEQSIERDLSVLYLNTEPEGAKVIIDSEYFGITPIKLDVLKISQKYRLELLLEGYENFERNIILRKSENRSTISLKSLNKIDKSLGPYSVINLSVDLPTYIYIDEKLVSKLTSVKGYKVKAGEHTIRFVNKKNNFDYSVKVNLKAGEIFNKTYNLR